MLRGDRSWIAPPFDRRSVQPNGGGRCTEIVEKRVDEDGILGPEPRAMALVPGHPRNDYLLAAADFDIRSAGWGLGALNPQSVHGDVENADVVPGRIASHARLDHDFLPVLTSLHERYAVHAVVPGRGLLRLRTFSICQRYFMDLSVHPEWMEIDASKDGEDRTAAP